MGLDGRAEAGVAPPSLWRNRDYLLLTCGETVSALGSAVAAFALPLVVFTATGSPLLTGLVATAGVLGNVLGALVVGAWVDRNSRRVAMMTSLAIRTATWFTLAALVASGRVVVPLFVVVAFLGGAATALFRSGEAGALKELIGRDQFPTAMSVIEGRTAAASLAGGPLGAGLLTLAISLPLWFNSASFLSSMAAVAAIRASLGRPAHRPAQRFRDSIGDGFRFIWGQRAYRWVITGWALSNFGVNGFNFALVLILRQRGEPFWVIGVLESCVAASILAGTFLVPPVTRRYSVGRIIVASSVVMAGAAALIAVLHHHVAAVLVLTAVAYLLTPASNAASLSYLAIVTPPEYQGRVAAAEEFASGALLPLSTIAGGFLLHNLTASGTLSTLAAVITLSCLVLLFSRAVRQLPLLTQASEAAAPSGRAGSRR